MCDGVIADHSEQVERVADVEEVELNGLVGDQCSERRNSAVDLQLGGVRRVATVHGGQKLSRIEMMQ